MPNGHGSRARTRDSFSRPFRKHGYIPISTYLRTYKLGDYVDIRVNSAVMKACLLTYSHCARSGLEYLAQTGLQISNEQQLMAEQSCSLSSCKAQMLHI